MELKGRAGQLLTTLKGVQAEVAKTEKAADKATTGISHNMSVWASVGKYATIGIAGAAIAVSGYSIKMAADFQRASLRLVTDAGESQKNLKMVQAGMLDLSAQTGTSAADIAKGMYLVESAGYHGAAGLTVMKAAAEGAKIGGADLATVSDALTTAMTDYSFPASQAAVVTSKLIATVGQGKTTMEALAGSLHNVLPQSSALHISFAQVTGAMATMTAEGISADQASQNLNHAILSLANPTSVQTKEMAAMGLNSTVVAQQLGKKGLTGTLDTLVQAITSHMGPAGTVLLDTFSHSKLAAQSAAAEYQGLGKQAQSLATQYMNGTISLKQWTADTKALSPVQANLAHTWASSYMASKQFATSLQSNQGAAQTFTGALAKMTGGQQGLSVALHLTGDHAAAFANNVKIVAGASSEASGHVRGWKETQQLFAQQMDQSRAAVGKMAIQIGTVLIPIVQNVLRVGGQFTQWLVKNPPLLIGLASVIGTVVGSMMAFYVASKIIATYKGISSMVSSVSTGLSKLAAGFANAEMAELDGAGSLGRFGGALRSAGSALAGGVKDVGSWASSVGQQAAAAAKRYAAAVGQMIAKGAGWAAEQAGRLAQMAAKGAVWVAQSAAQMGRWVATQAAAFAQAAVKGAVWVAAQTAQLAVSGAKWVAATAVTVASLVAQNAAMIAQKAVLIGGAVAMGVVTAAQWAWNVAMDANPIGLIILAIAGLIAIIVVLVTHWKEVSAFLVSAWKNVANFFVTIGNAIAAWWNGFWAGIVNWVLQTFGPLIKWINTMWTAMQIAFQIVGNTLAAWWNGFWGGIASFAQSTFNGYVSWIQSVWGGIVGFFQSVGGAISNAWNGLWSGLGDIVRNAFNGVVDFVHGIINGVIDIINGAIGAINGLIGGINAIPGVHVGTIGSLPHFADGGVMPHSGYALVGEAGPELVQMPGGSRVFPNGSPQTQNALQQQAPQQGTTKTVVFNNTFNTNADPARITAEQGWLLRLHG